MVAAARLDVNSPSTVAVKNLMMTEGITPRQSQLRKGGRGWRGWLIEPVKVDGSC